MEGMENGKRNWDNGNGNGNGIGNAGIEFAKRKIAV